MTGFATPGVRLDDLRGRRVVVWGAGTEGNAAVAVLLRHAPPAELAVIVDGELESGTTALSSDSPEGRAALGRAEVIVKSPGVSPYIGRFAEATAGKVVTGGTALWMAETQGRRMVGITGSKGKSTTSSLLHHLLASLGESVVLAGNIGRAPIEVLGERRDAGSSARVDGIDRYVFELSSFQCAEVDVSPEHGVLTALFPEHLNWHGTKERYYADKMNLFAGPACRLAANMANADVAREARSHRPLDPFGVNGTVRPRGSDVVDADGRPLVSLGSSRLIGSHNASNVAGALTALRAMGHDIALRADDLQAALDRFEPLAHRLQVVGTRDGRLVVDDSLSTAPQAAVAALEAYGDRPVSIIVGGFDRGLDYAPLATACAARTAATWVLGVPQSGERLVPLIEAAVAARKAANVRVELFEGPAGFDDAVSRADTLTPAGGVILLSPGAPSFGRFRDYRERGMHFRSLLGFDSVAP
jgi:UDP-N-acetylmuramoylalanine--D-glutamate ligase